MKSQAAANTTVGDGKRYDETSPPSVIPLHMTTMSTGSSAARQVLSNWAVSADSITLSTGGLAPHPFAARLLKPYVVDQIADNKCANRRHESNDAKILEAFGKCRKLLQECSIHLPFQL